ncbi:hypothetical protein C1H76_3626 [Elsinoe australis]|uniref:Uncharacterized protein n=1 Tax=Elsinoe australis TaxID=40998 RepID=A0A4U7AZ78_9PEZI|nr:hypothetical protein C1H76_3626 [Elsinoe australis]
MDDIGDEEDLFDQDFGDVPANTLQQLEQHAISLSQRPRTSSVNNNQVGQAKSAPPALREHAADTFEDESGVHPPSSDYGFDDEDVIDLDDPTVTFGQHDAPFPVGARPGAQTSRQPYQEDVYQSGGEDFAEAQQVSADLELMQARIAELERDRIRLSEELDQVKIDVTTKAGAIANLRARNERTTKDFEAKLAALRKEQADERTRLKADIQSAKNDQEKVKTSNKFLEHDLADERERSKRLRGTANGSAARASVVPRGASSTPKRAQKYGFADGFDDHEITAISPTKRLEKDRPGTPKAGNKRKRNAAGSPSVVPNGSPMMLDSPARAGPTDDDLELEAAALSKLVLKDERIETIQSVLHLKDSSGRQIIESLAQHHLPDDPTSIASHVLEGLSTIPMEDSRFASVAVRILDDSFGARHVDAETQARQEMDLLDRLANLFFDNFASSAKDNTVSPEEIVELRLDILRTLRAISGTQHGSTALAQSRTIIGKLIRFLCDQITSLYIISPLPTPVIASVDGEDPQIQIPQGATLHDRVVATVNLTTRILYHILHDHEIKLSEKLAMVAGGDHKFLIALSRIAFSERLLLEAGLEDEVVEAAHEILDKTLNPEEGEAILAAMDTPRSTHSGRPSMPALSAPE